MALSEQDFAKLTTRLAAQKIAPKVSGDKGFFGNVKNAFNERVEKGADSFEKAASGEQSAGSGLLQMLGQGAGFVGDIAFEGIKAVTPDAVEDVVKSGVEKVAQTQPVQDAVGAITQWAEKHPEAARNLQAVVDIASLFPAGKAAGKGVDLLETAGKKAAVEGTELAKDATVKVIDKASDIITPLDEGTKTALNPTRLIPKENLKEIPMEKLKASSETRSAKFDKYIKEAEQSVNDYSKPTALAKAGEKADEALNVINNKLNKQGQLKQEALDQVGDLPFEGIAGFRNRLRDEIRERVGLNLVTTKDGLKLAPAAGRASKIAFDQADQKLLTDTFTALRSLGTKPTVRQIDDTIDALQDLLYKRKANVAVPVNGSVEAVLKSITGELNSSVKKIAGEGYTKANGKYAFYRQIRDELNKALGKEGVKGASLMKQLFSPSGEAPRRLFKKIKELTGIDLVEEATFAKFAMENVGDARQASLLEEIINGRVTNPQSFVGAAVDKIVSKVRNPIKRAKREIRKSSKGGR